MKTVLKYLGWILLISAIFRIVPIIAALYYEESMSFFVISALISIILGWFLIRLSSRIEGEEGLTLTGALVLTALSFLIVPVVGAISFLRIFDWNILNALFEAVSGFTTTGFSVLESLEGVPKSVLLWRAETQWIGGIGIIMVFLFIFSRLRVHSYEAAMAKGEATQSLYQSQGFSEELEPGTRKTTRNILLIYSSYTVFGIILLSLVGLPFFDSIAITFASLSTGGFSVTDGFYTNGLQLAIICVLMILGSISFMTHNNLIRKRFKEFFLNLELEAFFIILAIFSALAFLILKNPKVILFQLISAFTTTGFSISEITLLPHLIIFLIMACMLIGGSIGSTAGGIKIFRLYTVIKAIPWFVKKLSNPQTAVIPFKLKGKVVKENFVLMAEVFISCYILVLLAGTLIFMLLGYPFLDSAFQLVSGLGTVGLQTMELSSVHWIGKVTLMIAMWLGRLEIFPLLVLINKMFKK
ncbi:TrkH family potassium uptake protein [Candidatus Woesearchaeota archaeon]|nr:TrkH family potassium uptake protein [Candidatus Woesearchaeota archaeon]